MLQAPLHEMHEIFVKDYIPGTVKFPSPPMNDTVFEGSALFYAAAKDLVVPLRKVEKQILNFMWKEKKKLC